VYALSIQLNILYLYTVYYNTYEIRLIIRNYVK